MNKLDEMYAAKERHVKEIGELMAKDPDSGVESADYVKAGASEYVKIAYRGGESVYIKPSTKRWYARSTVPEHLER